MAWFVVEYVDDGHDTKTRVCFRAEAAERLFGAERLLALFSTSTLTEFKNERTRGLYACIKRAAIDEHIRQGEPYAADESG